MLICSPQLSLAQDLIRQTSREFRVRNPYKKQLLLPHHGKHQMSDSIACAISSDQHNGTGNMKTALRQTFKLSATRRLENQISKL